MTPNTGIDPTARIARATCTARIARATCTARIARATCTARIARLARRGLVPMACLAACLPALAMEGPIIPTQGGVLPGILPPPGWIGAITLGHTRVRGANNDNGTDWTTNSSTPAWAPDANGVLRVVIPENSGAGAFPDAEKRVKGDFTTAVLRLSYQSADKLEWLGQARYGVAITQPVFTNVYWYRGLYDTGFAGLPPFAVDYLKTAYPTDKSALMGDTTISASAHWTKPGLLYSAGIDVTAPTGDYVAGRSFNAGRNYWAFEPSVSATWLPSPTWSFGGKLAYQISTANKKAVPAPWLQLGSKAGAPQSSVHTDGTAVFTYVPGEGDREVRAIEYDSGDILKLDTTATYALAPGLRIGWNVNAVWQVTDDKSATPLCAGAVNVPGGGRTVIPGTLDCSQNYNQVVQRNPGRNQRIVTTGPRLAYSMPTGTLLAVGLNIQAYNRGGSKANGISVTVAQSF